MWQLLWKPKFHKKIETTNDDMMIKTGDAVHMMIPTFSTRAMRMKIMQRYSRGIQPSLLSIIFSFITKESSVSETLHLQRIDDNVLYFLQNLMILICCMILGN